MASNKINRLEIKGGYLAYIFRYWLYKTHPSENLAMFDRLWYFNETR